MQVDMDNGATDIGITRGTSGFEELGAGSHSASSSIYQSVYSHLYRGIGRANNLIENMERASDVVPEATFNAIKGQAIVLRAYFYHHLMELFGDVPYTEVLLTNPTEALLPRESKSVIADNLLADLQTAAGMLPDTWSDPGRITRYVALGLRARIALYNGKYTEAANSAKSVIDAESAIRWILIIRIYSRERERTLRRSCLQCLTRMDL